MKNKINTMLRLVLVSSLLILFGYVLASFGAADNEPPQISIATQELTMSIHDVETRLLDDVTAWDKKDGDVTDTLVVESLYGITEDNLATVTYAAFDKSGNVTKVARTIRLEDYQSPRFSLSRALVFEFGSVQGVLDAVGVEDILDGDICQRVKATMLTRGNSVTAEGTHEVQFRVTNSLGDTIHLVMPVEVYPIGSYDAELKLKEYLVYIPKDTPFNPEDYLLTLENRQNRLDLQGQLPRGLRIDTEGTVDIHTPGVYNITFTAFYDDGTSKCTGYSRLIVVVEE